MTRQDVLNLFKHCDFNTELNETNFEMAVLDYLPQNFEYKYYYGASKLVLLPKEANFVIKIPFNGIYQTYYDDDDNECSDFKENENACNDNYFYWDYCATEVLAYRRAKSCHVERAFCKTVLVGFVKKHPIYIQEKAVPYCNIHDYDDNFCYPTERSLKVRKSAEELGLEDCWWNPVWQTDAFEYYGKKQYQRLIKFIDDYCIEDLHSGNIGYIGSRPILFDYSGWAE